MLLEIKKSLSKALYDGPSENVEWRDRGVEYSSEEGGGPVYMACRVLIVLPAR
jgi:hypothetical protein